MEDGAEACRRCGQAPPGVSLKRCAKCSTTLYCSRNCQKTDWKAQKKMCGRQANLAARVAAEKLSPPRGLDMPVAAPFTRLNEGTWLHGRPEADVYRLLIEAYQLRIEDSFRAERVIDTEGLYDDVTDGPRGFRRFLDVAAARPGLLPPWWDEAKRGACERLGTGASPWFDLGRDVVKGDLAERYGDPRFPMQLRLFAEAVYGQGPGGQDGAEMRRLMMATEQEGAQ